MREKLNSNPIAQVALVGALLVAVGFLFLTGMGGGGSSSSTATPTTPTTSTSTATAAPALGTTAPTSTATTTVPTSATSAVSVSPLPTPVTRAYKSGKTVVVLIVRNGGIDDRLVAQAVHRLAPVGNLAVFVVPAKQIARYASITLGVQVDRTPALIVMRPRRLSGGTPQASVTYGFQSPQTVVQAVLDASYDGPTATYHPN